MPSQCPYVGGASKLHGHPQSQLHGPKVAPFIVQLSTIALRE